MMMGDSALRGRRVLIVEDSPVVGPFTADILTDLGCVPIGPAPTFAAARELIEAGGFDAAVVDVHIRGERAFPLCDVLEERGVPFILTSGYADWQVPERWSCRPRLHKPYRLEGLRDALRTALKS
jgi:DNA-binding response OmpR family regulator